MGKRKKWLPQVGPGVIVASATVGAGETVLAVRAGAWGGYDLLWLILLATIGKSFATLYLMGNYAATTGQPVANKLVNLPGPRGWFLWVVMFLESLVAPLVFVVIAVPCGRLVSQLLASANVNVSYKWLALSFLTLAILVGLSQCYETLEKSQGLVCLILLGGTLTATILARPDAWSILKGLLSVGIVPPYPDWLPPEIQDRSRFLEMAAVFGYAGSIPMNYIVYANWVLIKGWKVDDAAGKLERSRALRPLRVDVSVNAILVFLVTSAFMVAGAVILNPRHRIPSGYDLLTEQAHIFAEISPLMVPLYYLIILGALWGTLSALPEIYGRGVHSFLCQVMPKYRKWEVRQVTNTYGISILFLSGFFIWVGARPIVMVDLVAFCSTNVGMGLTCVAAIWLDRQLPKDSQASPWLCWIAIAAAGVTITMALISGREVILRYL